MLKILDSNQASIHFFSLVGINLLAVVSSDLKKKKQSTVKLEIY